MTLHKAAFGTRAIDLMLILFAIGGMLIAAEQLASGFQITPLPSCPTLDHGYYSNNNVPCSNASCVPMAYYPSGSDSCINLTPLCDDSTSPDAYTATTTTAWYNCHPASSINAPACNEGCSVCANVYYFRGSTCTIGQKCTDRMGTLRSCIATQGIQ